MTAILNGEVASKNSAISRKLYSYKKDTRCEQTENKGLAGDVSRLFWCDNLECRNEARPTALVPEAFEESIEVYTNGSR
jgi:hypothetical protein